MVTQPKCQLLLSFTFTKLAARPTPLPSYYESIKSITFKKIIKNKNITFSFKDVMLSTIIHFLFSSRLTFIFIDTINFSATRYETSLKRLPISGKAKFNLKGQYLPLQKMKGKKSMSPISSSSNLRVFYWTLEAINSKIYITDHCWFSNPVHCTVCFGKLDVTKMCADIIIISGVKTYGSLW